MKFSQTCTQTPGLARTMYIYTVYIRYFWQENHQLYHTVIYSAYTRFWPTLTNTHTHKETHNKLNIHTCKRTNLAFQTQWLPHTNIRTNIQFYSMHAHEIISIPVYAALARFLAISVLPLRRGVIGHPFAAVRHTTGGAVR
jgi:hypothetical protein